MKSWTTFLSTIILIGCAQNTDYSASKIANDFCDCFTANIEGDIDSRLTPCMDNFVNSKKDEIMNSKKYKSVSGEKALGAFTMDILIEMTRTCDSFFFETNKMYDNYYPLDSSDTNRNEINNLTEQINAQTNRDSIKALLINKISRQICGRNYEQALEGIEKFKSIDKNDERAYTASAYIYNQKGMYDNAMIEIENANELSKNDGIVLFVEITRRRMTTDKK